ncbi:MAG: rubredoxin [Cyanobium sp.]
MSSEIEAGPADPADLISAAPSEVASDGGAVAASQEVAPPEGPDGEPEAALPTEEAGTLASEAAAEEAPPREPEDDPDTHRFECRSCGYVYDPSEGVKKLAIPPGTPFSALDPVGFRCPVCRSRVPAFIDIGPRNKASGFEENLDFGLGVNRLTPGQKNVLIFGGFALAIAFFLSLYSLR